MRKEVEWSCYAESTQQVAVSCLSCAIVSSTQKQTVQSLLPESVLTRGKTSLEEGHFFVGSCWRLCISHVNYLLREQGLGYTFASLFRQTLSISIN